ncbi:MAG: MBL fold metallo-hydrolase [Bacteriovoracaceae bacterium]
MSDPHPSVAAVLYYKGQVLTVIRSSKMKAFPGFTSFIGGKIEEVDKKKATSPKGLIISPTHWGALVREVKEEIGFELSPHYIKRLNLVGKAVTPEFQKHRFENYYYLIELRATPPVITPNEEIETYEWNDIKTLLDDDALGNRIMVPPTRALLRNLLVNEGQVLSEEEADLNYESDSPIPKVEFIDGLVQFLPLSNTLPPATRTNCFLLGDGKRVLVDPSPKDDAEYDKLISILEEELIDEIFLTHHHQDHHEHAVRLAKDLDCPIGVGKKALEVFHSEFGENYFEGVKLHTYNDGEEVCKWKGRFVNTIELPGHAEGQMGLAPPDMSWFIVGDLIQSIGTVVIAPPHGDMQKYFDSLRKVMELNPGIIIPSHGLPLKGIWKLEQTLQHRIQREAKIKELLKQGVGAKEMLKIIYPKLAKELEPMALGTIMAHLKKIKQ